MIYGDLIVLKHNFRGWSFKYLEIMNNFIINYPQISTKERETFIWFNDDWMNSMSSAELIITYNNHNKLCNTFECCSLHLLRFFIVIYNPRRARNNKQISFFDLLSTARDETKIWIKRPLSVNDDDDRERSSKGLTSNYYVK